MTKPTATTTRLANGQFAPGHPGGPGRPRRAIEADYLTALADACPLDTWRDVCREAVERALDGDAKAREWLSRYLLGPHPATLLDVAADELAGAGVEAVICDRTVERQAERDRARFMASLGPRLTDDNGDG